MSIISRLSRKGKIREDITSNSMDRPMPVLTEMIDLTMQSGSVEENPVPRTSRSRPWSAVHRDCSPQGTRRSKRIKPNTDEDMGNSSSENRTSSSGVSKEKEGDSNMEAEDMDVDDDGDGKQDGDEDGDDDDYDEDGDDEDGDDDDDGDGEDDGDDSDSDDDDEQVGDETKTTKGKRASREDIDSPWHRGEDDAFTIMKKQEIIDKKWSMPFAIKHMKTMLKRMTELDPDLEDDDVTEFNESQTCLTVSDKNLDFPDVWKNSSKCRVPPGKLWFKGRIDEQIVLVEPTEEERKGPCHQMWIVELRCKWLNNRKTGYYVFGYSCFELVQKTALSDILKIFTSFRKKSSKRCCSLAKYYRRGFYINWTEALPIGLYTIPTMYTSKAVRSTIRYQHKGVGDTKSLAAMSHLTDFNSYISGHIKEAKEKLSKIADITPLPVFNQSHPNQTKTPVEDRSCHKCNIVFPYPMALTRHLNRNHKENDPGSIQCYHCELTFHTKKIMEQHIKATEEKEAKERKSKEADHDRLQCSSVNVPEPATIDNHEDAEDKQLVLDEESPMEVNDVFGDDITMQEEGARVNTSPLATTVQVLPPIQPITVTPPQDNQHHPTPPHRPVLQDRRHRRDHRHLQQQRFFHPPQINHYHGDNHSYNNYGYGSINVYPHPYFPRQQVNQQSNQMYLPQMYGQLYPIIPSNQQRLWSPIIPQPSANTSNHPGPNSNQTI